MSTVKHGTTPQTGPIKINTSLTADMSVETVVTGEQRNVATVKVMQASMDLWTHTLTQLANTAETPYQIVAGQTTLEQGAKFTMQVPTSSAPGSVFLEGTIKSPSNPNGQRFSLQVASWTLS